jgi:hypothetical protein
VGFEAEPTPTVFGGGGLATCGVDDSFGGLKGDPLVGVESGSCGGELFDEEAVKLVAREAKGGLGKAAAGKNGGSARENDIGRFHSAELIETGAKAKRFYYGKSATAKVFATDAVPGIGACVEESERNRVLAEAESESEAGEATAHDGDRFQSFLSAEKKWVKGPACFSCRLQVVEEGQS